MIYQVTNGKRCNVAQISGTTADLQAISAVLEGECEIFSLVAEGGTEKKGIELNPIGFSVGKKYLSGIYRSAPVVLAHMKPTKHFADVVLAVKGVWDADFSVTEKSTYVNGFRATSKGV
jgi:hypothetical protein